MTRLQKIALYRMVYMAVYYLFAIYMIHTRHVTIWFPTLVLLNAGLLIVIKKQQKRANPGIGTQLDEFETKLELKAHKVVTQGSALLLCLGWLILLLIREYNGTETLSAVTISCFIFSIFPLQEFLHWAGIQYYTVNEDALKKPEHLVR